MFLINRDMFYNDYFNTPRFALINLYQDDNSVFVELEISGVNKEDIKVEYKDGILIISGEKKGSDINYIVKEIQYGNFKRKIKVGDIDFEKSKAEYKDGILKIELPQSEKNKSRFLDIK